MKFNSAKTRYQHRKCCRKSTEILGLLMFCLNVRQLTASDSFMILHCLSYRYWLQVCQTAYKFTRFQWFCAFDTPFDAASQFFWCNEHCFFRFQEAERQRFLNEQEKLDHQTKFGEIADHYRELRDNKKQLYACNCRPIVQVYN